MYYRRKILIELAIEVMILGGVLTCFCKIRLGRGLISLISFVVKVCLWRSEDRVCSIGKIKILIRRFYANTVKKISLVSAVAFALFIRKNINLG